MLACPLLAATGTCERSNEERDCTRLVDGGRTSEGGGAPVVPLLQFRSGAQQQL
jgi:hypothetical protein